MHRHSTSYIPTQCYTVTRLRTPCLSPAKCLSTQHATHHMKPSHSCHTYAAVLPAGRKSCAITCAKRLGAFLGDERIKDKGLNCTYVIAKK